VSRFLPDMCFALLLLLRHCDSLEVSMIHNSQENVVKYWVQTYLCHTSESYKLWWILFNTSFSTEYHQAHTKEI